MPEPDHKYTLRVTLFGPLSLENHRGRVEEAPGRAAQPWLLLKYLLVHGDRPVTQAELDAALPGKGGDSAARVRLSRLRDLLAPLGLEGKGGLVQAAGGTYRLNPRYTLVTDAEELTALLARFRATGEGAAEALALFRGPYLGKTPGAWAAGPRLAWQGEFLALAGALMARPEAALLPLLARQAQVMAPEYTGLHRDLQTLAEGKPAPRPALANHTIVSKIVIQQGTVYTVAAASGRRPLRYVRREEPKLTRVFQREGVRGLLTAVARAIHRGEMRTRADSKLTRALRKALHDLGLEEFLAMEEDQAVARLVELAEEAL